MAVGTPRQRLPFHASAPPEPTAMHRAADTHDTLLSPRPSPQLDPKPSSKDEQPGQAVLRCSKCGMREFMELDETQIQAMRKLKGLVRDCPACGTTGLWKRLAIKGS